EDARLEDRGPSGVGPRQLRERRAPEVDESVARGDLVVGHVARIWVPTPFVRGPRLPSDERADTVALGAQTRDEPRTDHAGRPGDKDLHRPSSWSRRDRPTTLPHERRPAPRVRGVGLPSADAQALTGSSQRVSTSGA